MKIFIICVSLLLLVSCDGGKAAGFDYAIVKSENSRTDSTSVFEILFKYKQDIGQTNIYIELQKGSLIVGDTLLSRFRKVYNCENQN